MTEITRSILQVKLDPINGCRELNVEPVIDETGKLLQQMTNAESHPAYSYICHTPTFTDAKAALEGHRKHLIEVREHLKLLWQLAESRVVGVSKVSKYQEKATKVCKGKKKPSLSICASARYMYHIHYVVHPASRARMCTQGFGNGNLILGT